MPAETPRVALAGNPNVGKTTLFNRLTGRRLKVTNYPGVTVERFEAPLELPGRPPATLVDLPGCYSLSAPSLEERIALSELAGLTPAPAPAVTVVVVDATQLTRNLYLVLQLLELGGPVVVALNMGDLLAERGQRVDARALGEVLGVPVVEVSGTRGSGLDELRARIAELLEHPGRGRAPWLWKPTDPALLTDIAAAREALPAAWREASPARADALAQWALLALDEEGEGDQHEGIPAGLVAVVADRHRRAGEEGRLIDDQLVRARYEWIDRHRPAFLQEEPVVRPPRSERIDGVLLHPLWGMLLFVVAMTVVFQSLFSWANPAIGWIEAGMGWLATGVAALLPPGLLADFATDGLIGGVGSVVVFLPQILLLFLFIGLMEDTGYMARIAVLMDRVMARMGLSGRAFVPMLSGFACAVPAILATRTMERQRDRLLTMMVIPLMTCSARLPVYTLIIAALFPPTDVFGWLPVQGLLLLSMYFFSVLMALGAAALLSRTMLRAAGVPPVMELPPYRRPHWGAVWRVIQLRSAVFVKNAGTIILACSVVLWALLAFPRAPEQATPELTAAAQLRGSVAGRLGHAIEPAIEPLGYDWKIGVGLISAFAAREVFVSTMGVVYGVGDGADEQSATLREKIRAETRADGRPVYTPLVGLSLMVFFALACQCMSTLAVVQRETRSWRWPAFLFAYMTALAWLASFAVYQGGRLLGLG